MRMVTMGLAAALAFVAPGGDAVAGEWHGRPPTGSPHRTGTKAR